MENSREKHRREMFAQVEACRNSGLSVREWCQKHNITETKYFYWQKQYFIASDRQQQPAQDFISLPQPERHSDDSMEIHYPHGVTVKVSSDIDRETLVKLIYLSEHV